MLLCLCLAAAAMAADTVHFREGGGTGYTDVTFDDTWISYNPASDVTHGNDTSDGIRSGGSRVALLAVKDMLTELPATSGGADIQINSATLHIFRYGSGTSSRIVSVYPVTTDWVPDSAGANENDCCYDYSESSSTTTWDSGDFSTSDYDTTETDSSAWSDTYNGDVAIDVTDVITDI